VATQRLGGMRRFHLLMPVCLPLVLAACGGGGGDSAPATSTQTQTSTQSSTQTPTYTIGGSVSGLTGSGLILRNNGGNDLAINSDGTFAFSTALTSSSAYSVVTQTQPKNPVQTCAIVRGAGTTATSNITDIAVTCETSRYTVRGTVSGLAGSGLKLQINGGDDIAVSTDGAFAFSKDLNSGSSYDVTVLKAPTALSQTCTVNDGKGVVTDHHVDVTVNCVTNTFAIGGMVTGLAGSGLVLRLNNESDAAVSENGTFSFSKRLLSGSSYTVTIQGQPSNVTQTCSLTHPSGVAADAHVSNIEVTCVTNSYAAGAVVSGLAGSGLVLRLNGGTSVPVSANGAIAFPGALLSGTTYTVSVHSQPSNLSQTCSVANGTGGITNSDISVSISCLTNSFSVGGTVTGLNGTGLELRLNGGTAHPISSNGSFAVGSLLSGTPYAATVSGQPANLSQTCGISQPSGTVTNGNVGNITITCVTNRYSLGGTVTGLAGSGLVLRVNGDQDLAVSSDGSFTFPDALLSGSQFDVTIPSQPDLRHLECLASNASGRVRSWDITDLTVTCKANWLIAASTQTSQLFVGKINRDTGIPQLTTETFHTTTVPHSSTITADGRFVYVLNGNYAISGFAIDRATGALTDVPNSPRPAGLPFLSDPPLLHPSGKYLYSVGQDSAGFFAFRIDCVTGELVSFAGNPISLGDATGSDSLSIHPNGRFLYVLAHKWVNMSRVVRVHTFAIDGSTGALSEVSGSPTPYVPGAPGDHMMTMTSDGGALAFSAEIEGTNTVALYAFHIDGATGLPTAVSGTLPVTVGGAKTRVIAHPTLPIIYVRLGGAFRIGNTVTPLTGSPFPDTGWSPVIAANGRLMYGWQQLPSGLHALYQNTLQSDGSLQYNIGVFVPYGLRSELALNYNGRFLYGSDDASGYVTTVALDPLTGVPSVVSTAFGPVPGIGQVAVTP
jgi:hypothetical protein